MMQNYTWNKQTMCQQTKINREDKKHLQKSMAKKRKKHYANILYKQH